MRGRWHGATVDDHCRGLCRASLRHPQDGPQLLHQGIKHAHLEPMLALLVPRLPGGRAWGRIPPHGARSDNPAQAIEDFPPALLALGGVFGEEGQVWGLQGPFIVIDITGVGFTFHTASVAAAG